MRKLTLGDLNDAAKIGGPGTLTVRTKLEPASGLDGIISPAKYTGRSGPTYVIEDRYVDGKVQKAVLIDARTSSSNRLEEFITRSIKDNRGILGNLPHIAVTYSDDSGTRTFFDTQLPHRAFDGHIRVGSHDGKPVSESTEYIEARNSTPDNMMPIFQLSPITVAFGAWDSTRNRNQLRIASPFNGEIIGVLANQETANPEDTFARRAGARVDPIAASIKFGGEDIKGIAEIVSGDISDKLKQNFLKGSKKGAGSMLGLGAIPPSTAADAIDGVAVSSAVRTQVVSFSTLRALRFGLDARGDAAIRTLLFAVIIDAMAGNNEDSPNLRANCLLRESAEPETRLDMRFGKTDEIERITLEAADELLEKAYDQAHEVAGINWSGQTFDVAGNPAVIKSGSAEDAAGTN